MVPKPSPERPRLNIPIGPILGGVALVGIVALLAFVLTRKKATPTPPPVVVVDTARAREVAESIATYAPTPAPAPAPTVGWVRVIGDLPDDAIVWLGEREMTGLLFQASPGSHALEVQTLEFEPWETRIRVRAGDTLKVFVDLVLKPTDSPP